MLFVKVTLYDKSSWEPIGQVTYTSGIGERLEETLTSFIWKDYVLGRVTDQEKGVSIKQTGIFQTITDGTSDAKIIFSKTGKMLSMVVVLNEKLYYQSRGLLVDRCTKASSFLSYSLPVSEECHNACKVSDLYQVKDLCRKDCHSTSNTDTVPAIYKLFDEMLSYAREESDHTSNVMVPTERSNINAETLSSNVSPIILQKEPLAHAKETVRMDEATAAAYVVTERLKGTDVSVVAAEGEISAIQNTAFIMNFSENVLLVIFIVKYI